jgi:ABC-2 type transport system permease protein
MRSRTSFFNKTLFWKSITRFWPVWLAYLIIWFLILPMTFLREASYGGMSVPEAQNLVYGTARAGGVAMGGVFGILAAMAVWSFLYSARSAHNYASLPLRREGVFCSVVCAGFAPILAANLVIAVLAVLTGFSAGWSDPGAVARWFAAVTLIGFFYYCFATLCSQLTGNILVLLPLYVVLNFVVAGVQVLLSVVFSRFVYGMDGGNLILSGLAELLSPTIGFISNVKSLPVLDETAEFAKIAGYRFVGWGWMLAYAGVGLVLLFLALLLLRRRKMETAGDVVAVQWLKPVFRWCMAVGMGLSVSSLMYYILYQDSFESLNAAFFSTLLWLLVGAVIGWFIAEMLIRKSFRVFRNGKQWAGLGVCCAILLIAMLGMRFDLFGYERYVPKAEDVQAVYIFVQGEGATLETAEGIASAQELHRHIIADKSLNTSAGRNTLSCELRYFLHDGRSVERSYALTCDYEQPERYGEVAELQALLNSREAIANRKQTKFPITAENIQELTVSGAMSVTDIAARAGFDDPEDYVLMELGRFTPAELREMDPQAKTAAAVDIAAGYVDRYTALPDDSAKVDWSQVYFDWEFPISVSPTERYDFYVNCILPDMDECHLGTVWLVQNEEYRRTVYDASIYISARIPAPQEPRTDYDGPATDGYDYVHFSTVPTVNAHRTLQWLEEHGVHFHTIAERFPER